MSPSLHLSLRNSLTPCFSWSAGRHVPFRHHDTDRECDLPRFRNGRYVPRRRLARAERTQKGMGRLRHGHLAAVVETRARAGAEHELSSSVWFPVVLVFGARIGGRGRSCELRVMRCNECPAGRLDASACWGRMRSGTHSRSLVSAIHALQALSIDTSFLVCLESPLSSCMHWLYNVLLVDSTTQAASTSSSSQLPQPDCTPLTSFPRLSYIRLILSPEYSEANETLSRRSRASLVDTPFPNCRRITPLR